MKEADIRYYRSQLKRIEELEAENMKLRQGFNIADVFRDVIDLKIIAHLIANKANMPYCWENILDRLKTGQEMPFKLTN